MLNDLPRTLLITAMNVYTGRLFTERGLVLIYDMDYNGEYISGFMSVFPILSKL